MDLNSRRDKYASFISRGWPQPICGRHAAGPIDAEAHHTPEVAF